MRLIHTLTISLLVLPLYSPRTGAQIALHIDLDEAPFHYLETEDENRVSRLINRLNRQEIELEHTRERGYLRSVLKALDIPESSQVLVFSKTSMQVRHISRSTPRAIYFNDDTYLGWIHGSSLVEISTTDPKLGAAFYTLDMKPWLPKFSRRDYDCLGCHATSLTQGVPGHTVRSVVPSFDGSVDPQRESFITNDTHPFSQRWGGWYVTGLHGEMHHMGNAYLRGGLLDRNNNGNRLNLRDEFDTMNYLSPYSDIVALMVLEHQTQMHNTMARADFFVRQLIYDNSLAEPTSQSSEEFQIQLELLAKEVIDRLLFVDETVLTSEVKGSSEFVQHFTERGPKDAHGRSLRDFDLKTRMFKYPVSYLIYTEAFDAMQPLLQAEVKHQLHAVLMGNNQSDEYRHLDAQTRTAALEILRATKEDWQSVSVPAVIEE